MWLKWLLFGFLAFAAAYMVWHALRDKGGWDDPVNGIDDPQSAEHWNTNERSAGGMGGGRVVDDPVNERESGRRPGLG